MNMKKLLCLIAIIIILSFFAPLLIALLLDCGDYITNKLGLSAEIFIFHPYEFSINEICNIIISLIFGLSSLILSYITFSLSKEVNKQNKENEELLKHASIIFLKSEINNNIKIILKAANKLNRNDICSNIQTKNYEKYDQYKKVLSKNEIKSLVELYDYFYCIKQTQNPEYNIDKYFEFNLSKYELKSDKNNIINIIDEKEKEL